MAGYKCKKCNEKNSILKEWIDLGVNRIVVCKSCGHKMNLNLSRPQPKEHLHTTVLEKAQTHNHALESEGGTTIDGLQDSYKSNYSIHVLKGHRETLSLSLDLLSEAYTIFMGRNPESKKQGLNNQNDVNWIINDGYVSRLHCSISIIKQNNKVQFILQDNGSANGTLVNNNSLEKEDKILLNIGDEITIGDTILILKQE